MISRRTFIATGIASLATWPSAGAGGEDVQLPLPEDLDGHALVRRLKAADVARVERLGLSRGGRPIDLISIGEGPGNVLIVGAPHANEPIGCATIVRLLARLASDGALRNESGWQWHFIPAIDLDGVALNQSWFKGSLTLPRYLEGFYRPPFRLQPEYAFPLDVPKYRFDQETPESQCWRRAIDQLRPQLQCSLHGADTGGTFFIVSDFRPQLAKDLQGLAAHDAITLNTVGDTSANLTTFAPGVFSFPDQDAEIAEAIAAGKDPRAVWDAGDSSAGYSSKQYQTFNMTCEVPLWRDARERDTRDSGRTLADTLNESIKVAQADEELLKPHLAAFEDQAGTDEARALLASVKEAVLQSEESVAELEAMKSGLEAKRSLTYRDLVQYEAGTAMFRTLAMAVRLAHLTGMRALDGQLRAELDGRVSKFQRAARLTPVPLKASTSLQLSAILATAHRVAAYKG